MATRLHPRYFRQVQPRVRVLATFLENTYPATQRRRLIRIGTNCSRSNTTSVCFPQDASDMPHCTGIFKCIEPVVVPLLAAGSSPKARKPPPTILYELRARLERTQLRRRPGIHLRLHKCVSVVLWVVMRRRRCMPVYGRI